MKNYSSPSGTSLLRSIWVLSLINSKKSAFVPLCKSLRMSNKHLWTDYSSPANFSWSFYWASCSVRYSIVIRRPETREIKWLTWLPTCKRPLLSEFLSLDCVLKTLSNAMTFFTGPSSTRGITVIPSSNLKDFKIAWERKGRSMLSLNYREAKTEGISFISSALS